MTSSDDPFLERWSRRKRGQDVSVDEVDETAPAASGPERADAAKPVVPAEADLPDVDTLDEKSDFTVFLQEGVPEALRRKALRRLWRLDPVFANLDGLNDYDEDYTDAATVVANLKTLYQPGRGMPSGEEPGAGESATGEVDQREGIQAAGAGDEGDPGEAAASGAGEMTADTHHEHNEPPSGSGGDPRTDEKALLDQRAAETGAVARHSPMPQPARPKGGRNAVARRWGGANS